MSRYALVEWARTAERDQGRVLSTLYSALAETALCRGRATLAGRAERTDRAEEEPLADPFRTPRPAPDLSNLGISRWLTLTASFAIAIWQFKEFVGSPFIEVARVSASRGNPAGIFDPELRYGSRTMFMYSAGFRLRVGVMHDRMGRYGAGVRRPAGGMQMGTMMREHGSEMGPNTHLQCSF